MQVQAVLRRLRRVERAFSPEPKQQFILEMWFPLMEAEGDVEKALAKAEREYREGKGIACIPYGTAEKFADRINSKN